MNSNAFAHQPTLAGKVSRVVLGLLAAWSLIGTVQPSHADSDTPESVEATPIVGGTSYGSAVAISPNVDYSGVLTGTSHQKDFFFFDVNPGAIVTLSYSSAVTWTASTYFYLEDQAHVTYLDYVGISGAEQTAQQTYMGKSTTPTRYYIRAEGSSSSPSAVSHYGFRLQIEDQHDGTQAYDAAETAASARVIAPALGSSTTYTGTLGGPDADDWYRVSAVSGQIISVSVSMSDYGPNPATVYAYIYDAANASSYKQYTTHTNPDTAPQILSYVSNDTTPAAYLIRLQRGSTNKGAARYSFTITSSQQRDANISGDAGDSFDSARMISPTLDATDNLLGSDDNSDFYLIDLPIDQATGANAELPYKMLIRSIAWPTGSGGYLTVKTYDATRALKGSVQYIQAPTTSALAVDLTNCDLCYVEIIDQTSGTKQFAYSFQLIKPNQVFIPLARR